MAQRTDAIVLGAGIVGTSVALQLAKRGLSVALIDRRGPGEETSYGNTGVIVGASVFPDGVSAQPQEAHPGRAQACAGSELSLGRSAQDRALARFLLPLFLAGEPEGQRGQAAAADEPRGRRARRAAAGLRCDEILSQDRLDHALSQRCRLRGDEAAARVRRADRRRGAAARHRGDAQARAEPQSGVPPFAVLAGCRLALQSADGDARLRGAARRARRRGDQGRCPLAASRRRQVARRYRRRADRCRECRGGARAVVARCAGAARDQGAARHQARLSPSFRSRRAMPRSRGR